MLPPCNPEESLPAGLCDQSRKYAVLVRSGRPLESLLPDIRRAIRAVDPELPILNVATMREVIGHTMTLERLSWLPG